MIIWQENIKGENVINYVGSIGRYSNIIEYYIDPFDTNKHIFCINLNFQTNTFKESEELFYPLFRQFIIDTHGTFDKILKFSQLLIRLEGGSICGYVADVEVFRACKDIVPNQWTMKILPIVVRTNSIEECKKTIKEKFDLAVKNILQELIKIN